MNGKYSSLSDLYKEISALKNDHNRTAELLATEKAACSELSQRIAELQGQRETFKKIMQETLQKKAELESQLCMVEAAAQLLQPALDDLTKQIKLLREEHSALLEKIASEMKDFVQYYQEASVKRSHELVATKTSFCLMKTAEIDAEIKAVCDDVAQRERSLAEMKEQKQELEDKIVQATVELQAVEKDCEDRRKEIEEQMDGIRALTKDLDELSARNASLQQGNNMPETELDSVLEDSQTLECVVDSLMCKKALLLSEAETLKRSASCSKPGNSGTMHAQDVGRASQDMLLNLPSEALKTQAVDIPCIASPNGGGAEEIKSTVRKEASSSSAKAAKHIESCGIVTVSSLLASDAHSHNTQQNALPPAVPLHVTMSGLPINADPKTCSRYSASRSQSTTGYDAATRRSESSNDTRPHEVSAAKPVFVPYTGRQVATTQYSQTYRREAGSPRKTSHASGSRPEPFFS